MNYYHYTNTNAFESILQNNPTRDNEICFWATRYDCFVDHAEYVHGIDKIRPILEQFEDKHNLQNDRRISPLFQSEEVVNNIGLPVPYVVSVTSRYDNTYLWAKYADKNNGVALELDFGAYRGCYGQAALFSIEKCIYDSQITNEELYKIVEDKYFEMAAIMFNANKETAFALLRDNPVTFVRQIAMYLLAFVAPRFKADDFIEEEETRIIIEIPKKEYITLFNGAYPKQIQPLIDVICGEVQLEKQRPDSSKIYREVFMPISVLKRVIVRNKFQQERVKEFLNQKGYSNIPISMSESF